MNAAVTMPALCAIGLGSFPLLLLVLEAVLLPPSPDIGITCEWVLHACLSVHLLMGVSVPYLLAGISPAPPAVFFIIMTYIT